MRILGILLNASLSEGKAGEEHLEEKVSSEGESKILLSSASVPFYSHLQSYSQHAAPLPHSGATVILGMLVLPNPSLRKSERFGLLSSSWVLWLLDSQVCFAQGLLGYCLLAQKLPLLIFSPQW